MPPPSRFLGLLLGSGQVPVSLVPVLVGDLVLGLVDVGLDPVLVKLVWPLGLGLIDVGLDHVLVKLEVVLAVPEVLALDSIPPVALVSVEILSWWCGKASWRNSKSLPVLPSILIPIVALVWKSSWLCS